MELAAIWFGVALAIAAIVIVWRATRRWSRVGIVLAMIAAGAAFVRPASRFFTRVAVAGPRVTDDGGYVGSGACRACHPSEHASWSRTYHRTMTQRGRDGVAITTGSHHMQGYWTEDEHGALHMLPYVYSFEEKKTIPRSEAFLEPPDAPQHDVRWSSNCIACHATAGRPHLDRESARPSAAELGIACEACHGPGAAHVAREHDPITRWRRVSGDIVNPKKLPPDRASAVCGQCHAYAFPRDEDGFFASGYAEAFRPGDALERSRILLTPSVLAHEVKVDTDARNLFWPDGTVRVGGREYNAMVLSACYLRGEGERKLTCMSCHSMHDSDPNEQLRKDTSVQNACISCHKMAANHSHHDDVECVSCHMPKTSYALRYAIRSHRIESPTVSGAKPNACNLCHLKESVSWAAREMTRLWGKPVADVADSIPASAYGLLMADAAERVIWADAFGDAQAIAASGTDWERSLLDAAHEDPYAVIRFIAKRSAAKYPPSTKTIVDVDTLVAHRDNRDVYVAE
ncbi:MAG TPA: ammonia-forming cytochrome c nitrite reductase subunit c552 [Polyangiaceae bacterium]